MKWIGVLLALAAYEAWLSVFAYRRGDTGWSAGFGIVGVAMLALAVFYLGVSECE